MAQKIVSESNKVAQIRVLFLVHMNVHERNTFSTKNKVESTRNPVFAKILIAQIRDKRHCVQANFSALQADRNIQKRLCDKTRNRGASHVLNAYDFVATSLEKPPLLALEKRPPRPLMIGKKNFAARHP